MWDKIFLLTLAVCSAIMAGLTYYSWSWLQSIGAPFAGAIIVLAAAAVVFIDQLLVVRLTEKLFPSRSEDVDVPAADETTSPEEEQA